MALDPTARESNIRDSVKKHFVDTVERIEGIPVMFDRSLSTPDLRDKSVSRWVTVVTGPIDMGTLSDVTLFVYCCARKDPEGFRLAQTRDTVMGCLTDADQTDGMKRIPFYRSHATEPWQPIGQFLVQSVTESRQQSAPDETKFKILTCRLRVASKL